MKLSIFCLIIFVIAVLAFIGCQGLPLKSTPAVPALSTGPAPIAATKTDQDSNKPIELSFAHQGKVSEWSTIHAVIPWIRQVEEATNGRVKITLYPDGSLCKAADSWVAVKTGIADMAWISHGNNPGRFPVTDVKGLPGIKWTSAYQASVILYRLYQQFPNMQKEFAGVKLLILHSNIPMIVVTQDKQVKSLDDMSGLRLRNTAGTSTNYLKAMGAIPVLISAPDMYLAIRKGIVDGAMANWDLVIGLKLYKVVNYYSEIPAWSQACSIVMNPAKWNSLPADIQEQIMSVSGLAGARFFGNNFFPAKQAVLDEMKKADIEPNVYTLPQQEADRWSVIARSVWEQWVKETTALGCPEAQEILDTMIQMTKDFRE
jgi:TRAP-type transport system periplasmic protein